MSVLLKVILLITVDTVLYIVPNLISRDHVFVKSQNIAVLVWTMLCYYIVMGQSIYKCLSGGVNSNNNLRFATENHNLQ